MENWKDVVDYEGIYEVSDMGIIRRKLTKRELKSRIDMYGYKRVTLSKNSKGKTIFIHRIVALAFLDNPHNKPQVNHIDGDKLNNTISNLEWCTQKENMKHANDNGLTKHKATTQEDVDKIRSLSDKGVTNKEIANLYGLSEMTIYKIVEKKDRYSKI